MIPEPRSLTLAVAAALALATHPVMTQTAVAPSSSATRGVKELAKGWSALAAGRAEEAERVSDDILRAFPRSHEAVALKIRSRLSAGNVSGALDAYEAWLPQIRQREDVAILEAVAIAAAETLARDDDPAVRARALELMAAAGDRVAQAQLQSLAAMANPAAALSDAALARLGSADAVQRLAARVKNGGSRDVSDAIDALRDGTVKGAAGVLAGALDPARPMPTKMAAARALGQLGETSAVPRLREALKDPDPPVRVVAAAALAQLGDSEGADIVRKFEASPVGDLRLLAVEGTAPGNPTGPWTAIAAGVLQDPDPLVKLRAAQLLLQHAAEPGAARDTLAQALADSNPATRSAAAQLLDSIPARALDQDLPGLRKLLRDPVPLVRVEAAAGILRISGAIQ